MGFPFLSQEFDMGYFYWKNKPPFDKKVIHDDTSQKYWNVIFLPFIKDLIYLWY